MSDRIAVINRGRLQQVGRPEELYESPANEFVANFIGESNLLQAEVTAVTGGRLRVRTAGGSELMVTGDGRRVGERLLVLMRPESLRLSADEQAAGSSLPGVIEEVIYLGGFRRYSIRINPQEVVTVKLPPQVGTGQLAPGTRVHVILEPQAARVL